MILKVFSIRDTKGELYHSPFFKTAIGEAERDFHAVVNDKSTTLSKYPEDFDLYFLGEFDNVTGKMKSLDTPHHLVKAVNCVKRPAMPESVAEVSYPPVEERVHEADC